MDLTGDKSTKHGDGSVESVSTPGEVESLLSLVDAVRTNLTPDGGVSVDQPPFGCGGSIPSLPTEHGNAEGTDEESEDPEIGEGGRPLSSSVRSIKFPGAIVFLSHDDRLQVAIARRGDRTIGRFLIEAIYRGVLCLNGASAEDVLLNVNDETVVSACEDYANEIDPERAA